MGGRTVLWGLIGLWGLLFAGAFIAFAMTDPTGDGFTRGINRVMAFLGWQLAAGAVAILVWLLRKRFERGTFERWAARVPAGLFSFLVFGLVALVLFARYAPQPAPETPPTGPVTAVPD